MHLVELPIGQSTLLEGWSGPVRLRCPLLRVGLHLTGVWADNVLVCPTNEHEAFWAGALDQREVAVYLSLDLRIPACRDHVLRTLGRLCELPEHFAPPYWGQSGPVWVLGARSKAVTFGPEDRSSACPPRVAKQRPRRIRVDELLSLQTTSDENLRIEGGIRRVDLWALRFCFEHVLWSLEKAMSSASGGVS